MYYLCGGVPFCPPSPAGPSPQLLLRTGAMALRVGLRISARYQTNKIGFDTAWYTGSVLAVNSDGSCDIA